MSRPTRFTSDTVEIPLMFSVDVTTPGEPPKSGMALGTSVDMLVIWHTGVAVTVGVFVIVGVKVLVDAGVLQVLPNVTTTSSTYHPPPLPLGSVATRNRKFTLYPARNCRLTLVCTNWLLVVFTQACRAPAMLRGESTPLYPPDMKLVLLKLNHVCPPSTEYSSIPPS